MHIDIYAIYVSAFIKRRATQDRKPTPNPTSTRTTTTTPTPPHTNKQPPQNQHKTHHGKPPKQPQKHLKTYKNKT